MPQTKYASDEEFIPEEKYAPESSFVELPGGPKIVGLPKRVSAPNPEELPRQTADEVISFLRPLTRSPALLVGGRAAAAMPGPPMVKGAAGLAAGLATYLGVDTGLQALLSKERGPRNLEESLTSSAIQGGINEVGAQVLPRVYRGIKQAWTNATTPIDELNPTISMRLAALGNKKMADTTRWLEQTFSPMDFKARQAVSAGLGEEGFKEMMGEEINRFRVGAKVNPDTSPALRADKVQLQALRSELYYKGASNQQASLVNAVAAANPSMTRALHPADPAIEVHKIEGPVFLKEATKDLNDYLRKQERMYGTLDAARANDPKSVSLAENWINITKGGQEPISFRQAWDLKQEVNKIGWSGKGNDFFKNIGMKVDSGIDDSLPNWRNNPQAALDYWRNAKAIVAQRNALFAEDGVRELIQTNNDPMPHVEAILADRKKLQRALDTSELPLPTGALQSNNMRQDLAAYEGNKLLKMGPEKAREVLNDPFNKDRYNTLFSQRFRADTEQLFKNLEYTQMKGTGSQSFSRIAMRHGSLVLPAALITGHLTNYTAAAGMAVGAELGGYGFVKLMNSSPRLGRALVAAAGGQPLNMTEQAFGRLITGALQGTGAVITLRNQDGSSNRGTTEKDSSWQPR